jgi:hypothetical protein
MPFDGCVSLRRLSWALRGSAVGGAGGEALRRAEMREPNCTLNLPISIGQTPPCPVANPGPSGIGPQSRRPNSPLPRRYGRKPGIAVFIGRHIFNRSFRNDVNAGVIRRTDCDQIFCAAVAPACANIVPVTQRATRFLPQTVR